MQKYKPKLQDHISSENKAIRDEKLAELVNDALQAVTKNKNMFVNNIFEDIVYTFKDLIFAGKFGQNTALGRIDKFVHDFEVQLKKEIYVKKPHLSQSVEPSVREFVTELEKNTSAFYEKYKELGQKREQHFRQTLRHKRFNPDGSINIRSLARAYDMLVPKTLGTGLKDILTARENIHEFISYAEKRGALLKENKVYTENTFDAKQQIRYSLEKAIKERMQQRLDTVLAEIREVQRYQKTKLSRYQDKRNAKIERFTEAFIKKCKKNNINQYHKIVKHLVRSLDEKGLFSYNGIQSNAAHILEELKRDNYFEGFSTIERQEFITDIKNRALSNEIVDHDRYGKSFREMTRLELLFKKPKYRKNELYSTPEALKQALLKRVENQELLNKSSMGFYVPELIDKLLELKKLKLPEFYSISERKRFIEAYKKDVVNSVCIRIDQLKVELIDAALDKVTEHNQLERSTDKLKALLVELKDQKIFKGRLHRRFITQAIIEKIWGRTPETTPQEFKKSQKIYRKALIDLYSKDVEKTQKKISIYNKVGLLASTGSFGLGVWAITAVAGATVMPAFGAIAVVAPFAIATSFTGLANSNFAAVYTAKKEFAQNIVDEILSGEEKEDYRELFSHAPTVGKLVISIFSDRQLKRKEENPYNLFYEFMAQMESLDKHESSDLVKELKA